MPGTESDHPGMQNHDPIFVPRKLARPDTVVRLLASLLAIFASALLLLGVLSLFELAGTRAARVAGAACDLPASRLTGDAPTAPVLQPPGQATQCA